MNVLEPGHVIKHYRLLNKIGQGGMGEVYKAEDTKLGRHVAIKRLPQDTLRDETARRRLLQEARSAAALNHPNIVTIHAIEDLDGFDFIVMEYVEGETLKSLIERQALMILQLIDIAAQVADALAAAHALNIIHRDIKSSNILIAPDGRAKVLDFGLAKIVTPFAEEINEEAPTRMELTGAGIVLGTIPYMSPEQTRGEPLDGRSDIFSLGCVLYEAVTGKLPFSGPSALSIAHNIAAVNPPPPSKHRADLPPELDLIIGRALAKNKEHRYQTALEFVSALKALKSSASESLPAPVTRITGSLADGDPDSFVGREPELRKMDEMLRKAIEGSGHVLFITGEPGIGKTAMIEEFLRRSRRKYPGLLISRGRCVEQYGTGEAYLPFMDAISALLSSSSRDRIAALLRTYAPTWCLQFPAVFVSSGVWDSLQQETMGATKERMLREMGDALGALAATSPLVIVLEDLHWADPSSIDLLRHLCQRVGKKMLMIVGTFRPEDLELNDHPLKMYKLEMQAHSLSEEIALDCLSQEHIACYLDAHFTPNNFPQEFSAVIQQKTEGHPLFAISLIQYLVETGVIAKVDGGWTLARTMSEMDLEAPENVRSMIRKKIDALEEENRRVLRYASVEGEEFLSTVVAALLEVDDLEIEERFAILDRTHRMVVTVGEEELPDGNLATRYRFAHALYQNVLYSDLVSKRRILLHRQAGEQLLRHYGKEVYSIAARLAMHFERGRDFKRAVEFLLHAGNNAARIFAGAEAAEHYGRAIELAAKIPDRDQATLLTLYQKRGSVNVALGRFQEAVDDYTEMLELARKLGSLAQESAALNALTMTLFYSHRLDEITARADEILQAAERAGSDALRIEAMQVIALKHLGYGELEKAKPMLDEIITSARSLSHKPVLLTGLAWRGILHFFQSEYERAEQMMIETRRLAEDLRDSFLLLESYFVLGMVRGNQGRMSEALTTFNEGIETARRYGDHFWSPRIPNCIGWVYRELQDFGNALKYDQQGLDVGRHHNVLEAQANSLINLGIDYGQAGEGAMAPEIYKKVEEIFQRDAWFKWRYNIRLQAGKCEHALVEQDYERAEEYAVGLLKTASHYEARKYIAVAHKLLARIALGRGNLARAQTEINLALAELRNRPVPVVAWKVYALLGDLHARSSDDPAARNAYEQSAEIVKEIAANIYDDKLRETFLTSEAVKRVVERSGRDF